MFGKKTSEEDINICIDGYSITRVFDTKCIMFMGVMVDSDLSWKTHIKLVENKVSKGIGMLYTMRSKLENKSLHLLYSTLILPYLDYCSDIWGNRPTYSTSLEKLEKLQKRAIRIIGGLKYQDHTSKTFAKYKCLKFHDMIELKTCLYAFKADKNLLPYNLQKRFTQVSQIHTHNTRKNMSLSVKGVQLYNKLSPEIKFAKSIPSFKNRIKKMFFVNY